MVDNDINVTISESTPINVTISESTPINVTIDSVIGSSSFIGLIDTPNDYVGSALKYLRVNSSANAIEFVNDSDIEITWGNIVGDISNQNDLQSALDLKYNSSSFNSDFDTRFGIKTTTDLNEGINLYYTQSRFDTAFGLKNTDDLTEGLTNFYDKIVSLTAGVGISVSGTYPNFTITNTGEANSFVAGNGISISESPDDTFTFSVVDAELSITESQISDLKNYFDKDVDTSDSITDTATNRFTNDIDISRLANTSGTNTGDQSLSSLLDPTENKTFSMGGNTITWNFTNPVGGMLYNMTGGWSGHVFEIMDSSNVPNGSAGDHLMHLESDRVNVVPLHVVNETSGATALKVDGYSEFNGNIVASNLSGTNTGDQTIPINSDFNLEDLKDVIKTDKSEGKILKVNSEGKHVYVTDESGTDEKVKYDVSDPTAGYIVDKFVAGTGISLAEGTGANENKLLITNSDLGSSAVTTHEGTYDHSLIATALQSETDPLSLHLDQTTPQTITNGIPLLTGLTPTTDYQISTKKYVDDSIALAIIDSWAGSY